MSASRDAKLSALDAFATGFARFIIRWRYLTILACLIVTGVVAANAVNVGVANNYRVFFSEDNPELNAFEEFQATYTKSDNVLFVLRPKTGDGFSQDVLVAVEALTEAAWKLPFAGRVDSVTNFQSTRAIGDELIVEDLMRGAASLSAEEIEAKRAIALAEPLVRDQLVSADGAVTAVNVIMQFPQKSLEEVPSAAAAARALRAEIEAAHPNVEVDLTGVAMLNNAFAEAGMGDFTSLVPIMYLVVLAAAIIALRSLSGTVATLAVISLSVVVAMGGAGLMGVNLTPISFNAPIVIMTLAVADSIHVLISMRTAMQNGMPQKEALVEAFRVNFLAITITSITTIVGFLALNFSDAPPFWHLGNMTAIGIFAAWAFSLTLLPALMSFLPVKAPAPRPAGQTSVMVRFADWVIERRRALLAGMVLASAALIALIPQISFNDQWIEYFDERIEFRRDSDRALEHYGLYPVEFSVPAGQAGGVSNPEFLKRLEAFTDWLNEQPNVTHVYSLSDIMRRLNKNMNADDPSFFRMPEDRELSAQYLLLYELSLPFGLDLNDRVNIDKSATRVSVTLGNITTLETKAFLNAAEDYIQANFPEGQRAKPTSPQVMFTYITDRNVQSMILGTTVAILAISLIMIVALQNFSLGLLSLIPNGLPILTTFGVWALLVGSVGFSVATVASISLGIIVDDTVHFLTKYQRARREHGRSKEDAIRYAFDTVGVALIVNTIILVLGFAVLTTSSFKLNVDLGMLTAISIVFALIIDFLLLPCLLLLGSEQRDEAATPASASEASSSAA